MKNSEKNKGKIIAGDVVLMLTKNKLPLATVTDIEDGEKDTLFPIGILYENGNRDRKSFGAVTKDKYLILLTKIYKEILLAGKADGEYSSWQEKTLEEIGEVLGEDLQRKLDKVLDDDNN